MGKIVKIERLSRVEGEGGLTVEIKDGKVKLHLRIFEAPRFFESFLRGRPYSDAIEFTSRICGICPVAHQICAVSAIEKIFGIEVEKTIGDLRRLLCCVEWIRSHALHVYLLQGPDFYGISSAWSDKEYIHIAKRGLNLKKVGNQILTALGGRSIHPVSVKVGGFYKIPDKKELTSFLPALEKAYEESMDGIKWSSGLRFDNNLLDIEYVSLSHPDTYPINEGYVISSTGLNKSMDGFVECIQEYQLDYSTALYSGIKRGTSLSPYLVGPISRINLNYEKLPSEIRTAVKESGIKLPITDTRMGIIARSIEIAYALHETIRIIKNYESPDRPSVGFEPQPGEATWITEAPRGILIHRYKVDEKGYIVSCSIITPTSQNLAHIEKDIYHFLQNNMEKNVDFLKRECENLVRGYDPCISCSVHMVILR